jgi:hypothetical protein
MSSNPTWVYLHPECVYRSACGEQCDLNGNLRNNDESDGAENGQVKPGGNDIARKSPVEEQNRYFDEHNCHGILSVNSQSSLILLGQTRSREREKGARTLREAMASLRLRFHACLEPPNTRKTLIPLDID